MVATLLRVTRRRQEYIYIYIYIYIEREREREREKERLLIIRYEETVKNRAKKDRKRMVEKRSLENSDAAGLAQMAEQDRK